VLGGAVGGWGLCVCVCVFWLRRDDVKGVVFVDELRY
jgi:hypothetical protein